jgi:hypothetical protein
MENFREFRCGPDPFGETWLVWFKWLQTAISIRHSDTIDVKFILTPASEADASAPPQEKTIALPLPAVFLVAKDVGVSVTDPWCARLAKRHLEYLITSGEDMEKAIVTPSLIQLRKYAEDEKGREKEEVRTGRRGAA